MLSWLDLLRIYLLCDGVPGCIPSRAVEVNYVPFCGFSPFLSSFLVWPSELSQILIRHVPVVLEFFQDWARSFPTNPVCIAISLPFPVFLFSASFFLVSVFFPSYNMFSSFFLPFFLHFTAHRCQLRNRRDVLDYSIVFNDPSSVLLFDQYFPLRFPFWLFWCVNLVFNWYPRPFLTLREGFFFFSFRFPLSYIPLLRMSVWGSRGEGLYSCLPACSLLRSCFLPCFSFGVSSLFFSSGRSTTNIPSLRASPRSGGGVPLFRLCVFLASRLNPLFLSFSKKILLSRIERGIRSE